MIKLLYAVMFFSLVVQGMSQCSLKNMSINHMKTHKYVKNKPVWNVTITNHCYCSQLDVKIACEGSFRTVKHVDPAVVKMSSKGKGLVNAGQPIYPYSSVAFTYAWGLPFRFKLVSSQVACS